MQRSRCTQTLNHGLNIAIYKTTPVLILKPESKNPKYCYELVSI